MKSKSLKKLRLITLSVATAFCFCLTPGSIASESNASASSEAVSQSEAQATYRGAVFRHGWNNLYGNFYYKGASYGFVINFFYNTNNGRVTNATYKATGYGGGGSKSKITSMTISYDEDVINISGGSLRINASARGYGQYSGSMTRGSHRGTCSMSI